VTLTSLLTNLASIPQASFRSVEYMGIVFDVYEIGRMVNKVPDVLCPQLMACKHFNRIVQDRLNNVLMGWNLSRRRSLPYHG
jgi:hypothetical protein